MAAHVDLFDSTYANFERDVLARVRQRTFGEDFGQNSWTTADEYRRWIGALSIDATSRVLEVASGSGGPALLLARETGCRIDGVDVNPHGIGTANERARALGLADRAHFAVTDATRPLPFADATFDALLCIDSANHFPARHEVLADWFRVLRPGGCALFTDPVVVTGLVTDEELVTRSAIGHFVFAPRGLNEQLIAAAGFALLEAEDATANAALVAERWHAARRDERAALVALEGEERFLGLQQFFAVVHRLTSERRLSRIAYRIRKPSEAAA